MPKTLSAGVSLAVKATYTNVLDLASATAELAKAFADALTSGTGADEGDLAWWSSRQVTAGTPDDLDLAGGLTDAFGATLAFARVKLLLVHNRDGTHALEIGGATNAFAPWAGNAGDTLRVRPGGVGFLWAPDATAYPVTAGGADVLRIAALSGSPAYDVVLLGASA